MSSNPLVRSKRYNNPLRRPNQPNPLVKREPRDPSQRENGSTSRPFPVKKEKEESKASTESYTEFKLRACSAEEIESTRHHVLKFHSKASINPKEFTTPIRFHRKDPRNLQFQLTISEMEQRDKDMKDASAELDRMAQEQEAKAKGQAAANIAAGIAPEPAPKADMSIVAPDGGARKINHRPFQKKTRQIILGDENSRKLRYEEYYPWVMEDFDGKNTWVGNYEAAQSDTFVLFVFDSDGFKMVPAEKWYKMTPRNKYTTLTLEEAEQRMEKKTNVPRWIMKHITKEQEQQAQERPFNARRRFKTVDGPSNTAKRRDEDHDEIDYDEEFADDEEAPIMDGAEEDVKEVEQKIKKEQRSANTIGVKVEVEEEDNDDFDLFNNPNEPKIGKEGRKTMKMLRLRERNTYYDSDEEENPYASDEGEETEEEDITSTTPKIKEELDLPQKIKKEDSSTPPPIRKLPKKKFKNLPPGMVILQLSPDYLNKFPPNLWNPSKRQREYSPGNEGSEYKKIRLRSPSPSTINDTTSTSPAALPSVGATDAASAATVDADNDPNLLTPEDVKSVIISRQVTPKELLGILKPRLRAHAANPERLKQFLRGIAKLHNGVLVLKDSSN